MIDTIVSFFSDDFNLAITALAVACLSLLMTALSERRMMRRLNEKEPRKLRFGRSQ